MALRTKDQGACSDSRRRTGMRVVGCCRWRETAAREGDAAGEPPAERWCDALLEDTGARFAVVAPTAGWGVEAVAGGTVRRCGSGVASRRVPHASQCSFAGRSVGRWVVETSDGAATGVPVSRGADDRPGATGEHRHCGRYRPTASGCSARKAGCRALWANGSGEEWAIRHRGPGSAA